MLLSLSEKHKFIFVHINKTAGSSMVRALHPIAAPYWKRKINKMFKKVGIHNKYFDCHPFPIHATAQQIVNEMGLEVFKSYFSFAIVRNPWDRLVSAYTYALKYPMTPKHKFVNELGSFEKYIKWQCGNNNILQKDFICSVDGELLVDFVGRFENLEEDNEALWEALRNNELKFVTTDHAGCNPDEEKASDNFWKVYGGIPGVEHRVPFLFSEGFMKNRISLEQTIKLLSTNAAKFFNLKDKGELTKDKDSDFALIDLWNSQIVTQEYMHSKGKYTPFEKMTFNSLVRQTFLRGKEIMNRDENTFGNIGYGKFVEVKT